MLLNENASLIRYAAAAREVPMTRKQPRGYQQEANAATQLKLSTSQTALVIVPTGGGKTFLMALLGAELLIKDAAEKVLVLQRSANLLTQNRESIESQIGHHGFCTSVVQSVQNDWTGDIVFGTMASVAQRDRLAAAPAVSHIIIDEAHHSACKSFRRIVSAMRAANPKLKVILYTATPVRGDRQPIAADNEVAYRITYAELIDQGILVPVRTYSVDLGLTADFDTVAKRRGEHEDRVSSLLDTVPLRRAVVREWRKYASERKTVVFCPTIAYAENLLEAFLDAGINADVVHSGLKAAEVTDRLEAYAQGRTQVLLNVFMLTEGWDDQPTSCVVNLRLMAEKISYLQAIGRGMRSVDAKLHPDIVKTDCLFLDFTGAAHRHGYLEAEIEQEREEKAKRIRKEKRKAAAKEKQRKIEADIKLSELAPISPQPRQPIHLSKAAHVERPADKPAEFRKSHVRNADGTWSRNIDFGKPRRPVRSHVRQPDGTWKLAA